MIVQGPICSSTELECVNRIKLDTSSCIKPCSGLIVNGFYKSEQKKSLENLSPIIADYNKFKQITPYPLGQNGKLFILFIH